jgi:hypothetical protein
VDPSTWYFRLSGSQDAVEDQKTSYLAFLRGLTMAESGSAATASGGGATAPVSGEVPVGHGTTSSGGDGLPQWSVPEGWQRQSAPNMVLARFTAGDSGKQVEITVSAFPGDVGGAVANLNRWRGQMSLAPLPEAEASRELKPLELVDGPGQFVEITGKRGGRDERMLGAIVPRGGRTWFYKLVGDIATADAQKTAFMDFVKGARHPQ